MASRNNFLHANRLKELSPKNLNGMNEKPILKFTNNNFHRTINRLLLFIILYIKKQDDKNPLVTLSL